MAKAALGVVRGTGTVWRWRLQELESTETGLHLLVSAGGSWAGGTAKGQSTSPKERVRGSGLALDSSSSQGSRREDEAAETVVVAVGRATTATTTHSRAPLWGDGHGPLAHTRLGGRGLGRGDGSAG